MMIRKIGKLLIMSSKIYKIIPLVGPLLMVLSAFLAIIPPHITEKFDFEEPALKTKLSTIQQNIPENFSINFQERTPGIRSSVIYGRLTHQTVLLVSTCNHNHHQYNGSKFEVLEKIYYSILKKNKQKNRILAKNVGFLCYSSSSQLQSFIKNNHHQFGIIRAALILQYSQFKKSKQKSAKKLYFSTYARASQLHVDTDFYQTIKQLLQQVGLNKWEPCMAVDSNKIMNMLVKSTQKKWWGFYFTNNLCQIYQTMKTKSIKDSTSNSLVYDNNNHIFQENGIQAVTLSLLYPSNLKSQLLAKLSRVGLSFVELFVILEDHLHSSSTIYIPLNQTSWVPLKGLIIPGIFFLIVGAAFLIIKAIYLMDQIEVPMNKQELEKNEVSHIFLQNTLTLFADDKPNKIVMLFILVLYCSTLQYYFNNTIMISVIIGSVIRLAIADGLKKKQKQMGRVIMAGFNILLCEYFTIICFPLSLLSIFTTNLICFLNKYACLVLIIIFMVIMGYFGELSLIQIVIHGTQISLIGQIALYPLFLWIFIL